MVRKYSLLVLMINAVLFFSNCAGSSDWTYTLPNGYAVWRINSNHVEIKCIEQEESGVKIPSFVKEFSYDERYVYSRNIDDVSDNNIVEEVYYVLDTLEKKVYGPFKSIKELQTKAEELGADIPRIWYRTSPDPNTIKTQKGVSVMLTE